MISSTDGLSAEEKIKQLIEIENKKRKEIDERKTELEKKRKELDELEEQRIKEIASTRKQIEEKIEELSQDQQQEYAELEELRRKREAETRSLEQELEGVEARRPREERQTQGYGDAIDEILKGRAGFYEVTNYNVMNRLESLASEVNNRPLTKNERDFLEVLEYHAHALEKNDFYRDKDGSNYLKRELTKIDFINKTIKERDNTPGDYQP